MSIIRPCNPSLSDLFVFAVFFCLFVCLFCLILALSVLPIILEQTSTLFLECVASISVRFRIKERRTRARSSDGGDWSVLDSYTGKNEEGGWGWWPPARSRLTSGADMKLCCFLLFVFLFLFLLVIVTFLSFVVSSSPVGITLECKQIVPFSSPESLLSALW